MTTTKTTEIDATTVGSYLRAACLVELQRLADPRLLDHQALVIAGGEHGAVPTALAAYNANWHDPEAEQALVRALNRQDRSVQVTAEALRRTAHNVETTGKAGADDQAHRYVAAADLLLFADFYRNDPSTTDQRAAERLAAWATAASNDYNQAWSAVSLAGCVTTGTTFLHLAHATEQLPW